MNRATAAAATWLAASLSAGAAAQPQGAPRVSPPGGAMRMEDRKPAGDSTPIPQDETVVITVTDGRTLAARPKFAIIRKHQPLEFAVRGLPAGMSVEIDFAVTEGRKGPFPRAEGPANPVRGRYVIDARDPSVKSARSDAAGFFKYTLVLRKGSDDVFALDPGVIIKNEF